MAASNSKTNIANLGLINLGQPIINDLDNPTTFAGGVMAQVWDDARQCALRAGAWRFALTDLLLPRDVATPVHSWSYQYTLPANCMLLQQVGTDDNPLTVNVDYKIKRGKILTNEEGPLPLVFVDDITDVTLMPPDFKFAMGAYLAHLGAPPILQSTDKAGEMLKLFEYYMDMAGNNNALENAPKIIAKSKWLGAQRNLGRGRSTW